MDRRPAANAPTKTWTGNDNRDLHHKLHVKCRLFQALQNLHLWFQWNFVLCKGETSCVECLQCKGGPVPKTSRRFVRPTCRFDLFNKSRVAQINSDNCRHRMRAKEGSLDHLRKY